MNLRGSLPNQFLDANFIPISYVPAQQGYEFIHNMSPLQINMPQVRQPISFYQQLLPAVSTPNLNVYTQPQPQDFSERLLAEVLYANKPRYYSNNNYFIAQNNQNIQNNVLVSLLKRANLDQNRKIQRESELIIIDDEGDQKEPERKAIVRSTIFDEEIENPEKVPDKREEIIYDDNKRRKNNKNKIETIENTNRQELHSRKKFPMKLRMEHRRKCRKCKCPIIANSHIRLGHHSDYCRKCDIELKKKNCQRTKEVPNSYNPYVMMERRFKMNGRILRSDVNQYGEEVEKIFLNKIMVGSDYQAQIPDMIINTGKTNKTDVDMKAKLNSIFKDNLLWTNTPENQSLYEDVFQLIRKNFSSDFTYSKFHDLMKLYQTNDTLRDIKRLILESDKTILNLIKEMAAPYLDLSDLSSDQSSPSRGSKNKELQPRKTRSVTKNFRCLPE